MVLLRGILLVIFVSGVIGYEDDFEMEQYSGENSSTTESSVIPVATNEAHRDETDVPVHVRVDSPKNGTNVSHLRTFTVPIDWDDAQRPKLNFPKTSPDEKYKMASLHLDKGWFIFDFLRGFLSLIQPFDLPTDLLTDTIENRISTSKFISESMHVEAVFLGMVVLCCVLLCVLPGIELWLACRPIREDYKPSRHPRALTFLLAVFVFILGSCMVTMIVCNQMVSSSIEKIPETVDTVIQDFNDYHTGTTQQVRKCLTRSLDVASEAILADLDNVEELLGKPVQLELSSETGLDVALDALLDLTNASQELSARANALLEEGEKAAKLGSHLSEETDDLRRSLERVLRACTGQDRPLCAIIDSSSLKLTLRIDRLLRDDRLLRLRGSNRENLTEAGRQARGEYLYVPQHIARSTLDTRNQIRREINRARAKIFDEARGIEASSSEVSRQLESARRLTDSAFPYVTAFEYIRWYVGLGSALCILPFWLLLFGALCCRCGSSDNQVRPTLLCGVFTSCLISIALWVVFILALALASHIEMLVCRPLHDPEYHTIEAVLESRTFLGKRLTLPLKDLLQKCERDEAAYPAFGMGNTMKLDQLSAHWSWTGLTRATTKLRVDLKGLKIFTPNLQQRLQNLLYACGSNLTEHRTLIQGPVLSKDLDALSDQVDSVSRQLRDRITAKGLNDVASSMRELASKTVKPLMKLQDDLVYKLALLELQVQPLQRQVNQSISHLKTIQYYIDNQGGKIAQLTYGMCLVEFLVPLLLVTKNSIAISLVASVLSENKETLKNVRDLYVMKESREFSTQIDTKTKMYVDRMGNYLDQWRGYVLSELGTGVVKCRPLWDILEGIKLLLCGHILGGLDGFWFAMLISLIVMIASTPTAHILSLVFRKPPDISKHSSLIPARSESPETVVIDRETWQTPEPPPPQESW